MILSKRDFIEFYWSLTPTALKKMDVGKIRNKSRFVIVVQKNKLK